MVSTKRTSGPSPFPRKTGGFTLFEVMMVTLISAFVFAGVLSAYIFLGRSLARQVNAESLESRTRLALYWFARDVSSASTITAVNPGALVSGNRMTLSVPGLGTVTYSLDWSGGAGKGILNRQVGANPTLALLTNLTSFSFGYYDPAGNTVTAPATAPTSPQINIKEAYMTYVSTAGLASTGAQSNFTVVSPRIILKNQGLLVDPTSP